MVLLTFMAAQDEPYCAKFAPEDDGGLNRCQFSRLNMMKILQPAGSGTGPWKALLAPQRALVLDGDVR